MDLSLEVTQKQTLSQNMIQALEILQMNTEELAAYIENAAVENPLIDFPDFAGPEPDRRQEELQRRQEWLASSDRQNRAYYQTERGCEEFLSNQKDSRTERQTLQEFLWEQLYLKKLSETEKAILGFLIESLDSRGYFTENLTGVASLFEEPEETIRSLLQMIQELDPAGVGARNLPECLKLQLKRKGMFSALAENILEGHLEDLARHHLDLIARKLHVNIEDVRNVCKEIKTLNPKPACAFPDKDYIRYIRPDALVAETEQGLEVIVNEAEPVRFTINAYYKNLLGSTGDAAAERYLQTKLDQAEWLRHCISNRSDTLLKILRVIVKKQESFFKKGPPYKQPLRLKDIAKALGLHESTVSRAVNGKYVQCAFGIFPVHAFLAASVTKENSDITPEQIKSCIHAIINSEDKAKPLSDQKIAELLTRSGKQLSRRTVNKYRTEMGIPDKIGRTQRF